MKSKKCVHCHKSVSSGYLLRMARASLAGSEYSNFCYLDCPHCGEAMLLKYQVRGSLQLVDSQYNYKKLKDTLRTAREWFSAHPEDPISTSALAKLVIHALDKHDPC